MPSSITPLLVDIKELKKVFGSKDSKLFRDIIRQNDIDDQDTAPDDYECEEDAIDEDDMFDDEDFEDEDEELEDDAENSGEELPSSKDALRHIIMGEPWARGIGSKYGYMFLEICRHLGEGGMSKGQDFPRTNRCRVCGFLLRGASKLVCGVSRPEKGLDRFLFLNAFLKV